MLPTCSLTVASFITASGNLCLKQGGRDAERRAVLLHQLRLLKHKLLDVQYLERFYSVYHRRCSL